MFIQWRRVLVALALVTFSLSTYGVDEPQADLLHIVQLQLKDHVLDDSLLLYHDGTHTYLPLGAFVQAVDFDIQSPDGLLWQGHYFDSGHAFLLSLASAQLSIDGIEVALQDGDTLMIGDELFIKLQTLNRWFSINLNFHYRSMRLDISANELFLIERTQNRKAVQQRTHRVQSDQPIAVKDAYQWLGAPKIDAYGELRNSRQGDDANDIIGTGVTASFDFLKHQTFLTTSQTYLPGRPSQSVHRLTFERAAATEGDVLFLGADHYGVGDVYITNTSLAMSGGSGLGFILEKKQDNQSGRSGVVALVGDAPPGWEAEVYRNNELLGFGRVDDSGRYVFPDQVALPGRNDFVIKLYGPQGQYEEQTQLIWGGGLKLEAGEYSYRFGHIDFQRTLLDGAAHGIDILPAQEAAFMEYDYGLSKDLQLGVGVVNARVGDRHQRGVFSSERYSKVNFSTNLFNGVVLGEFISQHHQGHATDFRYFGNLGAHSVYVSHQQFDDFESPHTVRNIELDSKNEIAFFGTPKDQLIDTYSIKLGKDAQSSGIDKWFIQNRLGTHVGQSYLGNELLYSRPSLGPDTLLGNFIYSHRIGGYSVMGRMAYTPLLAHPISLVSGSVRWQATETTFIQLQLTQTFSASKDTLFHGELAWKRSGYHVFFAVDGDSNDYWSASVGIKVSIGFKPHSHEMYTSGRNLARTGTASFNFFMDENNNAILDADEEIISDVKYKGTQSESDSGQHYVVLKEIPAWNPYVIDARRATLRDPYLTPTKESYELYTHPGGHVMFHIPVVLTGDIEGLITTSEPDARLTVVGLQVELMDQTGKVVKFVQSEFDGYFQFTGVPLGEYRISVIDSSGNRHDAPASLKSGDNYLRVADFVLPTL